jgi:hypothetical protein
MTISEVSALLYIAGINSGVCDPSESINNIFSPELRAIPVRTALPNELSGTLGK